MRTIGYAVFLMFCAIFLCAQTAFAQTPPGAVPLGSLFLYPAIEAGVKRDSNIALTPNAASDTIYSLRPSLRLEPRQGENVYGFSYQGDYGRYNRQTTDNYENHELNADANVVLDMRNRLKVRAQYLDRVDPRGTLNLAATPTPNRWRQPGIFGLYTYGAQDAEGKLEVEGAYIDKRYINNRFVTFALDYDKVDYGGTFLWRVQPKTYLSFNLKQSVYDYKDSTVTLDSKDTFALVGVRWEATAATSGRFAIGRQTKKFDSAGAAAGRRDYSGGSWEGGVTWKPLTYSSVDFRTQRRTADSTGLGDFTVNQTHGVLWTHAWSDQFTTIVTGTYANDKFAQAPVATIGGLSREDTTKTAGLRANYQMRRWLKIGADYIRTIRDSNDNSFDYSRNQMMLFVSATP